MEFEGVSPDILIERILKMGEKVEVEVSPKIWVPATVTYDMEHRVAVRLVNPILVLKITKTVTHAVIPFLIKSRETTSEESKFTTTWGAARQCVRFPK